MSAQFRSRVQDPVLERLYDYWSGKRSAVRLPGRRDIDPVEMRDLLRYVVLADLIDGERIRFRLVGTNMVDRWGSDFTGRHLDEIMFGDYRTYLEELFLETARDALPIFSTGRFRWDVGRAAETRRLFLPLASDGRTVDKILVGQTFTDEIAPPDSLKISEARPEEGEIFRARDDGDAIAAGRP
ncbi:PAS domain-containing protein [Minwuia thermotolerans]|nr:PAS domain-containing protein [Minwuia thermotolerans]